MWTHFIYSKSSGVDSNPYISTSNKNLFRMIYKYDLTQYDCKSFVVESLKIHPFDSKPYEEKQNTLREFAIDWQNKFSDMAYDGGSLADWGGFFEEYGKKYGLLREFKENGII